MPHTKLNSKWIKDLNVRAKAIKLLENIGAYLRDLGLGNSFLDMTPKAQATKGETDKLGFIKTKFLCFKGHYQEN